MFAPLMMTGIRQNERINEITFFFLDLVTFGCETIRGSILKTLPHGAEKHDGATGLFPNNARKQSFQVSEQKTEMEIETKHLLKQLAITLRSSLHI